MLKKEDILILDREGERVEERDKVVFVRDGRLESGYVDTILAMWTKSLDTMCPGLENVKWGVWRVVEDEIEQIPNEFYVYIDMGEWATPALVNVKECAVVFKN